MTRLARTALIIAVALAAAAAGYLVSHLSHSDPSAARQLLALTLPDSDGKAQALQQWQGKILVVNFWATWCPPCREDMPGFSRLQSQLEGNGVQFVGIGIDSASKINEFSKTTPVSYPLLVGSPGLMEIMSLLGNEAGGLPFTVVFGRDGHQEQSRLGIWKEAELQALLGKLSQ